MHGCDVWILSAMHVLCDGDKNHREYNKKLLPITAVRFVDENDNNFYGLVQQVFTLNTPYHFLENNGYKDIAVVKARMQIELPFEPMNLHCDPDSFAITSVPIESFFIGFGDYGVNKKVVIREKNYRHLGATQVLLNKSPSSGNHPAFINCVRQNTDDNIIDRSFDQKNPCSIMDDDEVVKIYPLKNQAIAAEGDSGGPLIVDTNTGPQVVGILSFGITGCTVTTKKDHLSYKANIDGFVPVIEYNQWIKRVLKGDYQEPTTTVYNYNTHFRVMEEPVRIDLLEFNDGTRASSTPTNGWTFSISPENKNKLVRTGDKIAYGDVVLDLSAPLCKTVDYLMNFTTATFKIIDVKTVEPEKHFKAQFYRYCELLDNKRANPSLPRMIREFLHITEYHAQKNSAHAKIILPKILNDLGCTLFNSALNWRDDPYLQVALLREGEHHLSRAVSLDPSDTYKKSHSRSLINLGKALINWSELPIDDQMIAHSREGLQLLKRGISHTEPYENNEDYIHAKMIHAFRLLLWSKKEEDIEKKIDVQREVVQIFKEADRTHIEKHKAETTLADAHYNLAQSLHAYSLQVDLSDEDKSNTYRDINALLEVCMNYSKFNDAKNHPFTLQDLRELQNLVAVQPKMVSPIEVLHAVILRERAREANPRPGHIG